MEHLTNHEKHRCLSLLVMNNAGVLSRISGLFSRRGYNIDALTVGTTEDEKISRITITVSGDDKIIEQIIKQLYKLIDVIKIVELEKGKAIRRELVYIKVKADDNTRSNIVNICNLFRANVVDVAPESLIPEDETEADALKSARSFLPKNRGISVMVPDQCSPELLTRFI